MSIQYKFLEAWRSITYRRILLHPFISNAKNASLALADILLKNIVCLLYPNRKLTQDHLNKWKNQTSALFSPELTPLSIYAQSTTDAKVALESADFGQRGKLLFISHGAYQIQNVSSLLIELASTTTKPFTTVLIFRRQNYPHVEDWWKSYGLCFKINIEIVHNDTLLLIQRTKELLDDNQVVLCAPDFYFSTNISYEQALANYLKTVSLYLKLARIKHAEVYYIKCCNQAEYSDSRSFLIPVENYDQSAILKSFQIETSTHPENWFFAYNHYSHFDWSNAPKV
jgi:hypothetical protein